MELDRRVSSQCLRRERPVLPSKRGHVGQLREENGGKCGKTMAEDFVVQAVRDSIEIYSCNRIISLIPSFFESNNDL